MMKATQILPTILMAIDLGAGIIYVCHGDIKRAIYWVAAATLTATVTF